MDLENFVQIVKELCKSRGTTPTAAAEASGAGRNFMDNVKKGSVPSVAKVQLLADYLGVSTSELLGEDIPSTSALCVPVLGSIPAGIPLEAIEDILDWEEVPAAWADGDRDYFGLVVRGDSMYPEYLPGDVVILRKEAACESGDDCAVLVNGGEATLKRVYLHDGGGLELRPVNASYPPRTYTPAEVKGLPVQLLGVVVELRRKKK